jgi:hypothetical protein
LTTQAKLRFVGGRGAGHGEVRDVDPRHTATCLGPRQTAASPHISPIGGGDEPARPDFSPAHVGDESPLRPEPRPLLRGGDVSQEELSFRASATPPAYYELLLSVTALFLGGRLSTWRFRPTPRIMPGGNLEHANHQPGNVHPPGHIVGKLAPVRPGMQGAICNSEVLQILGR